MSKHSLPRNSRLAWRCAASTTPTSATPPMASCRCAMTSPADRRPGQCQHRLPRALAGTERAVVVQRAGGGAATGQWQLGRGPATHPARRQPGGGAARWQGIEARRVDELLRGPGLAAAAQCLADPRRLPHRHRQPHHPVRPVAVVGGQADLRRYPYANIQSAAFYTNIVDTRTDGFELAGHYQLDLARWGAWTSTAAMHATTRASPGWTMSAAYPATRSSGVTPRA